MQAQVQHPGPPRVPPLETSLIRWRVRVIFLRLHVSTQGAHAKSFKPGAVRESQVKGIQEEPLLLRERTRALPNITHRPDTLDEVHLCEDCPKVVRVQYGGPRIRVFVVELLSVPKQHERRGTRRATVKELVQEGFVVTAMGPAARAEEPHEAKVGRLNAVGPAAWQIPGPTFLIVEVQPREAPTLVPKELVRRTVIPGAMPEVDNVPGLGDT
mmetsp:Transcript_88102/g.247735  ORF Transcript_88102/g.247735 Transcript_88102/m.247735 type:complete len:213 (+) Transcript_88102:1651-2289(+)